MTHEERLALIHKPFFMERFSTSYPWGGVFMGTRADLTGRLLDNYVILRGKRLVWGRSPLVQFDEKQLQKAQSIVWNGCDGEIDPNDDPADYGRDDDDA